MATRPISSTRAFPHNEAETKKIKRVNLTNTEVDELIQLIDLNFCDNPWNDQFLRSRNQLLVHTQLGLACV
jgi:hypothetical protein